MAIQPNRLHRQKPPKKVRQNVHKLPETREPITKPVKEKPKKRRRWDAILDRVPIDEPWIGVEIGVLNGNTSMRLLAERPLLTLIMIDPWEVPKKGSSYDLSDDDNSQKSQEEHDEAYELTCKRVKEFGSRAVIYRAYSEDVADVCYKNESIDFVFIDGDHSYEGVKKDIELWLPKIKKTGFISGHDYGHERLPGVKKAVDQLFHEFDIELDDNRTWFVQINKIN